MSQSNDLYSSKLPDISYTIDLLHMNHSIPKSQILWKKGNLFIDRLIYSNHIGNNIKL